jgi:multidrug efflux system membrane fusion protein
MEKDKRKRGALLFLAAAVAALLAGTACDEKKGSASGGGAGAEREPVPVVVATAEEADVPVEIHANGTVEAIQSTPVRAQVGGLLNAVRFREGDTVSAGQVLFEIDSRPIQATIRQLEANLARDQAQLRNAQAQLQNAEAQAQTADAQMRAAEARAQLATAQAKRYQELVQKDYVTREQYDELKTNADASQETLVASRSSAQATRANIEAMRASIEATRAAIDATKASIENAKVQLSYTLIRSPITGQAGSLLTKTGDLVKANDTTPLVVINQIQPILIRFAVPEADLPEVQKYRQSGTLKVRAEIPGRGGERREGKLVFLDNAVDRATGTITLKAELDNRDAGFWPGQFVNVALELYVREKAVVVPTPTVQVGQQGTYAFLVDAQGTAVLRQITAGPQIDGKTIVEEGIKAGETVVTDGQLRLTPGAKVQPKPAPGSGESQAAKGPTDWPGSEKK